MRYRSSIAPRTSKLSWALLMLMGVAMIVVLYSIKAKTLAVKAQVGALEQELVHEQQAVHVLRAEIALLESPERLRALALEQLGLQPTPVDRTLTLEQAAKNIRAISAKTERGAQ